MIESLKYQSQVLSLLLKNKSFFGRFITHLEVEFFVGREHKEILGVIKGYYREFGKQPTPFAVLDILQQTKIELQADWESAIQECSIEVEDPDYITEQTYKFIREQALAAGIRTASKLLASGNLERINDVLLNAFRVGVEEGKERFLYKDAKKWHQERKEVKVVPTLLHGIDSKLAYGGAEFGTLGLIWGPYGTFKSTLLRQFAIGALNCGFDCLFITLEMSSVKILEYLMGLQTASSLYTVRGTGGIRMDRFEFGNPFKSEILVADLGHCRPGPLEIEGIFDESITKYKPFNPQALFIDYLGLMASGRKREQTHEEIEEIGYAIHRLARKKNIVTWAASQGNRESLEKKYADAKNIAQSFGQLRAPEYVLGTSQTKEEKADGILNVTINKNRDEATSSRPIPFKIDHRRSLLISDYSGRGQEE